MSIRNKKRLSQLTFFSIVLLSAKLWAAPCCGGAGVSTSLIIGEPRAQFASTYLFSYVVGDALTDGTSSWRSSDNIETQHGFFFDGAYVIADRWQILSRLPVLINRHELYGENDTNKGFGDFSLGGAFEAFPEWRYSPWQPKIHLFSQLLIPLGRSVYESTSVATTDAFSRGFWTFSFGAVVSKFWNEWDIVCTIEGHQGIPRSFYMDAFEHSVRVTPGFGYSLAMNPGYSFESIDLHLSVGLTFSYDTSARFSELLDASSQVVWNPSLQLSYAFSHGLSLAGIYTDQTLLGPVKNVALRRYVGLTLTKAWER